MVTGVRPPTRWPLDKGSRLLGRAWRITPCSFPLMKTEALFQAKKWAARFLSGPYSCEGKNLQRGTVVAAALGGKPLSSTTERDMVPICAVNKDAACMSGMPITHGSPVNRFKVLSLRAYLIYLLVKKRVSYHVSFFIGAFSSRAIID